MAEIKTSIPDINNIEIKIPLYVFEAWGFELQRGQRLICEGAYCKFLRKYAGPYDRPSSEEKTEMIVDWYRVKFLDSNLYPEGKLMSLMEQEFKVLVPVELKNKPNKK